MASVTPTVAETLSTPLIGAVTETETKTEIAPLIPVVPAQDAASVEARKARNEAFERLVLQLEPPAKQSLCSRLALLCRQAFDRFDTRLALLCDQAFDRFDTRSIPLDQPRTGCGCYHPPRQLGHFERLALDRELILDCLYEYNKKNPGNEYEPAPGNLYWHSSDHNGVWWCHGNFVARKKRTGWLSFLPATRTLFFFEIAAANDFNGIVTCTSLDEPVTESHSVLGFRLGFCTRRSGKLDSFCKTCSRRFDVPDPACEHQNVEKVCGMCYDRSDVLHPPPGEFAFGYHPYKQLN